MAEGSKSKGPSKSEALAASKTFKAYFFERMEEARQAVGKGEFQSASVIGSILSNLTSVDRLVTKHLEERK